jgi:hypothetical protein
VRVVGFRRTCFFGSGSSFSLSRYVPKTYQNQRAEDTIDPQAKAVKNKPQDFSGFTYVQPSKMS